MSETPEFEIGPESRVAVLRHRGGYAVAVVVLEGPFSHDEATRHASELRRRNSGRVTKAEAAALLGITRKGVDYLRSEGLLSWERQENGQVLITKESIDAELAKRNG